MNREQVLQFVREYVSSESLIRHMLSVEAAMRFYARMLGQDEEEWAIAGLLHDYDWEIHPNPIEHPLLGLQLLRDKGISEEIIEAIGGHGDETGIPRRSLLSKGLYACDEVTGLITAVALVRPSRSLHDLTPKSVRNKWKDRSFAAGADRTLIAAAAEEFGVELWQHVDNVSQAMRTIAAELGLDGVLQEGTGNRE
ncbi:MAG: HDIG domain-containing protein [Anaerolineaceae bacterium]|nr:HDIG domain-containing protein [Anaerolineaceae bacterium]